MRFSVSRSEILLRRTQKLKRSVLCFLLVASCYLLVAAFPTFAQTGSSAPSATANPYTQPQMNPDVPKNLHTWTQNVMIETMAALTCQLAGIDPVNPNQKCLGVDQKTGNIGFVENGGGAIGLMGNAITMLYAPPASSGQYFQSLASNFGLVKSAKAQEQGTGFQSLTPLLRIWTAFRNMVYLIFVIIFVVIGMAIMLRVKIDPRTVMSIQNQIPKIIIGLILVTFSFAISGFLIDIMYTSIYLAGNTIVSASPTTDQNIVSDITRSTNTFSAASKVGGISGIASAPADSVGGFMSDLLDNTPGRIILGTLLGGAGAAVGFLNIFAGVALGVTGLISGLTFGPEIIGPLAQGIAFVVIAIAIIWALIRLWFALISAYVFLLLDVVMAPFWIMAGLMPGSPVSFGLWLRDIVSNLAAFPVAIIMFILGRVMIDAFASEGPAFSPPMAGLAASPSALGALIGLGFILLTPNVVNITKAALKAPKFDTTPIKQAIGVGAAAPGRVISGGMNAAFGVHYTQPGGPGSPVQMVGGTSPLARALRAMGVVH